MAKTAYVYFEDELGGHLTRVSLPEAETVGPGLQGLHAADGITLPLPPRHFQWLRFFSGISTPRHVSSVSKLTYVLAIPFSGGWESALPHREPP
jgi:hypothetical protein